MNVVDNTTLTVEYPGIREDCCTKYRNFPAKPLEGGGMLPFIQQFSIWADLMRRMLYFVQE
ncbi:hypothetical protein V8V88_14890 [Paenibacillus phytohabitans]